MYYIYITQKGVSPIYETEQDILEKEKMMSFSVKFTELDNARSFIKLIKDIKDSREIENIMFKKEFILLKPLQFNVAFDKKIQKCFNFEFD